MKTLLTLISLLTVLMPGRVGGQTFVDRTTSNDLRLLTYNVFFDHMFPDTSATDADKFARIVNAVAPDIINVQEIFDHSAADAVARLNSIAPLGAGNSWHAWQGSDNIIISKYPLSMTREAPVPAGNRDLAMALVDLPDAEYHRDLYLMNTHYKCCGGFDQVRQQQSDSLTNWMRDARHLGESIDLPGLTPMLAVGDFNIVESQAPLTNLLNGNVVDQNTYGPDSPPDWDGSSISDAQPLHNVVGPENYTWRNDWSQFDPGILDYVLYSDHVAELTHSFVLNTTDMSPVELSATGLMSNDVVLNPGNGRFDHLPLVTDFRWVSLDVLADLDGDGALDVDDLDALQTAIQAGTDQLRYDYSGEAQLNAVDFETWLFDIYGTIPGDANLDRVVDGADFLIWNENKFQSNDLWSQGDFNFDGTVDGADFLVWNDFKFTSLDTVAVPEPVSSLAVAVFCVAMCSLRIRAWSAVQRTTGLCSSSNDG